MNKDLEKFSEQAYEILNSDEAYDIIDDKFTSWMSGGCYILARALNTVIGHGQLFVLECPDIPVDHVVLGLGGYYLDGDGIQSVEDLILKWELQEFRPNAKIAEFNATVISDCVKRELIYYNEGMEDKLVEFLRKNLPIDLLSCLGEVSCPVCQGTKINPCGGINACPCCEGVESITLEKSELLKKVDRDLRDRMG